MKTSAMIARAPKLLEKDVTSAVKGFLELEDWRVIRLNSGLANFGARGRVRYGEVGMPDFLVIRPVSICRERPFNELNCKAFFLELKRPGKEPRPDQHEWMDRQRSRGLVCVWFDCFEKFEAWYREMFR